jgi:hypothetical protein
MWISRDMTNEIEAVARVFYVDWKTCVRWNEHRRPGEPRLMSGWAWEARAPHKGHRLGIKTMTACYIDAWYALVARTEPPRVTRPRLLVKVPTDRRAA